jgi:pimeloyl-ACP methyl ester carboxylesterase
VRGVALLGATGSIGRQAIEVVAAHPELELCALQSGSRPLDALAAEHGVEHHQVGGDPIELLERSRPDIVLNAVVGFAGVRATLWALEHGVTLALANKESLVAAGDLALGAQERGGGLLIPVDSEHSALHQCLEGRDPATVSGLVLTGSSGLFERGFTSGVPHRPDRAYVRRKMEEVFFDPGLVTEGWVEDVHRVVTTPASALRVLRFARDARRDNLEARLEEVRVPTLLVWGLEDRITPPEVGERFRALLRDAQLWHLPRCGHAPMLEWPEPFADIVGDWLEGTRARRSVTAPQLGGVR